MKISLLGFRNFSINYERRGGELIKMGDANNNFEILNWVFQSVFRSNPARLGELGGNLLPLFPIKRQKGDVLRVPDPPDYAFQLFWVKKIVSVKKIQAEVLP